MSGKNVDRIRDLIKRRVIDHDHYDGTSVSKYESEFKLLPVSIDEMPNYLQKNFNKYEKWFDLN